MTVLGAVFVDMNESKRACLFANGGNQLQTSKYRVAKLRERKRRGVLFMGSVEVMERDLRVLKRFGYLTTDDPTVVDKDAFGDALGSLLDGLAKRFGLCQGRTVTPAKGSGV